MNLRKLNLALKKAQKLVNLDFALSRGYCCTTCTYGFIEEQYGIDAKGIFVKYYGLEFEGDYKKNRDHLYIKHYLNEDDFDKIKDILYDVFSQYFEVEWTKEFSRSMRITDKKQNYII